MKPKQPFITAENITIRARDKFFFENTSFRINTGEQWLIVGANGAGKTVLAKALAGILPLKQGEIILHFLEKEKHPYPQVHREKQAYISFDSEQEIIVRDEFLRDIEAEAGVERRGMKVGKYLFGLKKQETKSLLEVEGPLDREIVTLSTGELRRVFLGRAILKKPKLLILDEPFNGLDSRARKKFMKYLRSLMKNTQVILITHNVLEVPKKITHVMIVEGGRIRNMGEKRRILSEWADLSSANKLTSLSVSPETRQNRKSKHDIIVSMQNVTVLFGKRKILDNVSWEMRRGENWAIVGHNGAGKTTLTQLITGEQQQVHANSVKIFGRGRSELSVWELWEKIGVVSPNLHLKYIKEMKAVDVILSGFFDSIGLYRRTSAKQRAKTEEWIERLKLGELAEKNFNDFSFGQKRLVLIARAVVKSPKLLILDEPTHGLDQENKQRVLKTIEKIGQRKQTSILLITHQRQEIVPSITHVLELNKGRVEKQGN